MEIHPPGVTGYRDSTQQVAALQLHQKIQACLACRLHRTRSNTVFGKGHLNATLMIVGEAPGAQEDAHGIPFCGMSGELLSSILRELDPEFEQHVFITNTIRCRPPENREPLPVEVKKCAPLFQETVKLVNPVAILALGNTAARMLTGQQVSNISRLREESQGVLTYHGVPLRFGFHPAYIRRNYSLLAVFKRDLKEALDYANNQTRAPQAE